MHYTQLLFMYFIVSSMLTRVEIAKWRTRVISTIWRIGHGRILRIYMYLVRFTLVRYEDQTRSVDDNDAHEQTIYHFTFTYRLLNIGCIEQ